MKQSIGYLRGVVFSLAISMAFLVTGCGSSVMNGGVEDSAPTVTVTEPVQDATGIPLDTTFEIVFDTVMDPASISDETVYLLAENLDGTVSAVAATVDAVYNDALEVVGAVLSPVEPLIPEQVYQVIVTTGVTDLLGNSPVSNITSTFTVSDVASMVVPIVWPVADTVLSTEAAQTLLATLSSLMGVAGEGLALLPVDLTTLAVTDVSLYDVLAAVQALNPAADTVEAVLATPLSAGALLGIVGDLLPVGSEVLGLLDGVMAQLPTEVIGTNLTLGDILTLPATLLPLDPLSLTVQDALNVATNPLALLESVAQVVDAGALVTLPVVGPIIASVTDAAGLELVGGVLSQLTGAGTLTALVPTELNTLVDTILANDNPTQVVQSLLGYLDGGLLSTLLGTLTTLLGGDLADLLTGLLDGLPTGSDPTSTLTNLLGLLSLDVLS